MAHNVEDRMGKSWEVIERPGDLERVFWVNFEFYGKLSFYSSRGDKKIILKKLRQE